MTSIAAIVYSSDNIHWTRLALECLRRTSARASLVLVDNGSDPPYSVVDPDGFQDPIADRLIRYDENIGGNAVFHRWREDAWWRDPPDILAFLHCDLMVSEEGWDDRVVAAFEDDPKLALLGFVGSNEIDAQGGRGAGTVLNFQGLHFPNGMTSPAEHHGRRITGLEPAAVVDHCAMIFRRTSLETLTPQEGNYAPEHFYDRLLSCEVVARDEHVAVLGVACDHFSGGIGDGMAKADGLRRKWLDAEGLEYDPGDTYSAVYKESERRFFDRYKGFFPFKVNPDYSVVR